MRGNSGNQNPQPQGQGSRANAVSGRNAAQALSQKVQKSPREGGASAPAAQNGAARVFALDVECVATGMVRWCVMRHAAVRADDSSPQRRSFL